MSAIAAKRRKRTEKTYLLDLGFSRFPFLSSTFKLLIRYTHVDGVLDRVDVDNLKVETTESVSRSMLSLG